MLNFSRHFYHKHGKWKRYIVTQAMMVFQSPLMLEEKQWRKETVFLDNQKKKKLLYIILSGA